jgi:UDP-N-acetylglucosamine 2-epimerase (non-hydrolysing)/GDP/UDP-N,N'-diacetylbacillosamine 2-epimerase (hydrolysing)
MARRIAIVTTSRADYGCLYQLLTEIRNDPDLELLVVATGMHLSVLHGSTAVAIEADGFNIARRVPMILATDDEASIAKSIGLGLIAFADVWAQLRPDIMVCLGDRFELLAPVIAALLQRVPIAHIHGGETSQGAVDEAVRHSISKMASIHFPSTLPYAHRLIQMGEAPERVFAFGAPALDGMYSRRLLTRDELARRLELDLSSRVAIVTYHPVTLEVDDTKFQIKNLLDAVSESGVSAVFTRANADASGSRINAAIEAFCSGAPQRYRLYDHLGQVAYLSCLQHLAIMIGNSSSGLVEAPSFRMPVVNIGNRQQGRVRASNVIDTDYARDAIVAAIRRALAPEFRRSLADMVNPHDIFRDGRTSWRIKEKLKEVHLTPDLLKKRFHDLAPQTSR